MYVKYCVCALVVTLSGCLVNEVGQRSSDTEQDMQSDSDTMPDMNSDMNSDMSLVNLDMDADMVLDMSSDMGSLCGDRVCPDAKVCVDDGVLVARCVCPDGMRQDLTDPENCVPLVVRMCMPDLCKNGGECFLSVVPGEPDMMVPECRDCDEGYVGIEGGPGNFCTECQQGYSMQNGACLRDGPIMCDEVMCEGNKVCMNDAMGAGLCQCPDGLQDVDGDDQCERSCASYFPDVMTQCNGHGACVERTMEPRTGFATCECESGYQPAPGMMSAPNCQACTDPNFFYDMTLEECLRRPPVCMPTCGAAEECVYDALNVPVCMPILHATCESHRLAGASADGFYTLHVDQDSNKPWQAWCAGMQALDAQEYLSLGLEAPDDNVFMRTGSELTRSEPLQRRWTSTRYEMIRIDPVTLKVNIFDDTFSFTTSSQFDADFMTSVAEPVPFGMAQGCTTGLPMAGDRESARGRINLAGLPFSTTGQVWSEGGRCASFTAPVFMDSGRQVTFDVNGGDATQGCGVIVPDNGAAPSFLTSFETGCGGAVMASTNAYPPADPYQIQLTYDASLSTTPVTLPRSCREARGLAPYPTADGDYTLYHDADVNRSWTAYCKDMNTLQPVEYLTLPEQTNGANNFKWGTFCGNSVNDTNAEIQFEKVKIDPYTLYIDMIDQTFATIIKTSSVGATGLRYGHTRSCSNFCGGDIGTGKVDLTGTGFKVTDPFYSWGSSPVGGATASSMNQVVSLSITGACGEIAPLIDGNLPGIDRKSEQRYMTIDFL